MPRYHLTKVFGFCLLFFAIIGCQARDIDPVSTPVETTASNVSADKHLISAFESYQVALDEAKKWHNQAVLYQIPQTRIMEANLGLPPGGPPGGWFFMFKISDSPLEYYIEVVDGALYGKTEAQPILIGESKYVLKPIDIKSGLLDNPAVLSIYLSNGGSEYLNNNNEAILDYRLVNFEGLENPVWSIFDVKSNQVGPLVNIDAKTGEIVSDPYIK